MKEAEKAEFRFRPGLDDDIKVRFNELPKKVRSTILRDALRVWFGIPDKLEIKPISTPVRQPEVRREERTEEVREVNNMPKPYRPK